MRIVIHSLQLLCAERQVLVIKCQTLRILGVSVTQTHLILSPENLRQELWHQAGFSALFSLYCFLFTGSHAARQPPNCSVTVQTGLEFASVPRAGISGPLRLLRCSHDHQDHQMTNVPITSQSFFVPLSSILPPPCLQTSSGLLPITTDWFVTDLLQNFM